MADHLAWRWQHQATGVLLNGRDRETVFGCIHPSLNSDQRGPRRKPALQRVHATSNWDNGLTFPHNNDSQAYSQDSAGVVLEQAFDCPEGAQPNPIEHLWRDWKMAVQTLPI